MRLLVGRLTPAMRAKSVTPCGDRAGCRPAAAVYRFRYHLERATNVKSQRLPCLCGPASLLNLRLDISGLLMDSGRFRQPRQPISCTKLALAGFSTPFLGLRSSKALCRDAGWADAGWRRTSQKADFLPIL